MLRTLQVPVWAALVLVAVEAGQTAAQVEVLETPHDGIQPQAVVDAKGTLHLIYFKGEALTGDLFYVRREAGQKGFSSPTRVNSQPGSAVATGTVRGGQLALGKDGRVHVAWNGSGKAEGFTHTGRARSLASPAYTEDIALRVTKVPVRK